MFDTLTVRMVVSNFYDHVLPLKIHMKASRLLNERLEINSTDLHPSNCDFIYKLPPKTASQVLVYVQNYRIQHDTRIKDTLANLVRAGPLQMSLQVSLITAVLAESGVLQRDEICEAFAEIPTDTGRFKEIKMKLPKHRECFRVITQAIEGQLGSRTTRLTADQLPLIIRRIVTKNLWFAAFVALVRLLGINVQLDEMPGGSVSVDEADLSDTGSSSDSDDEEDFRFAPLCRGMSTDGAGDVKDMRRKAKRNNIKMLRVFRQLSNHAGFLPLDLADEAILLLTDARLHFSGVVACLQALKIGSMIAVRQSSITDQQFNNVTSITRNKRCDPHTSLSSNHLDGAGPNDSLLMDMESTEVNPIQRTLDELGLRADTAVCDIEPSSEEPTEKFDWTELRTDPGWSSEMYRGFNRLTATVPGFMGKSQMIEFVKDIQRLFQPRDGRALTRDGQGGGQQRFQGRGSKREKTIAPANRDGLPEGLTLQMTSGGGVTQQFDGMDGVTPGGGSGAVVGGYTHSSTHLLSSLPGMTDVGVGGGGGGVDFEVNVGAHHTGLVSFEIFHKVASKLGFSSGRRHSRIQWVLFSAAHNDGSSIVQFLPALDVCLSMLRFVLQPTDRAGRIAVLHDDIHDIYRYRGYFTYAFFRRYMRRIGVNVQERCLRALWEDLPKAAIDVAWAMPDEDQAKRDIPAMGRVGDVTSALNKYLRIEMDRIGMDPMKGRIVSLDTIRKHLPRMLMTGLWPEALRVLLRLSLQVPVHERHLGAILVHMERRTSRYGLIKPEDVGNILANLSVEGMTFPMLREVILKMRLVLPDDDVKRMFDLMDLNLDKSLSLKELLGGFEVLFRRFVPALVLENVGLSYQRQVLIITCTVVGLMAFFSFIGLAFSSFTSLRSGMSTAIQSILALAGAVGLQSSASEDRQQVEERMKERIDDIMGDQLSLKAREYEEAKEAAAHLKEMTKESIDEGKPVKLRYFVPKKFRPELQDPFPCVTFTPGSYVRVEPTVSGRVDRERLRFVIIPRLPQRVGLKFDNKTGVLEGIIPLYDDLLGGTLMLGDLRGPHIHRPLSPQPIPQHSYKIQSMEEGGPQHSMQSNPNDASAYHPVGAQRRRGSVGAGYMGMGGEHPHHVTSAAHPISPPRRASIGPYDIAAALGRSTDHGAMSPSSAGWPTAGGPRYVRMGRRTFTVICRNSKGSARARITFQITPKDKMEAMQASAANKSSTTRQQQGQMLALADVGIGAGRAHGGDTSASGQLDSSVSTAGGGGGRRSALTREKSNVRFDIPQSSG
eukprot:GHVN01102440.1.p1 GENE.GHVN01102440.1~~GHVN01102440.1.p1  ORF type:complete len:1420 (-),score=275.88 GHVN01102440.1:660-4499(-)